MKKAVYCLKNGQECILDSPLCKAPERHYSSLETGPWVLRQLQRHNKGKTAFSRISSNPGKWLNRLCNSLQRSNLEVLQGRFVTNARSDCAVMLGSLLKPRGGLLQGRVSHQCFMPWRGMWETHRYFSELLIKVTAPLCHLLPFRRAACSCFLAISSINRHFSITEFISAFWRKTYFYAPGTFQASDAEQGHSISGDFEKLITSRALQSSPTESEDIFWSSALTTCQLKHAQMSDIVK